MKTCHKCHRELPEEQFHKSQKNKDGYQNVCKECTAAYAKARYASMKAAGGGDGPLSKFTSRQLLEELKSRGYKFGAVWLEEVQTIKHFVKV